MARAAALAGHAQGPRQGPAARLACSGCSLNKVGVGWFSGVSVLSIGHDAHVTLRNEAR